MDKKSMTRRDALKLMGATAVGAIAASSGLFSLTSCVAKKKRIIFYFTGTGNCLQKAIQFSKEAKTPLLANGEANSDARYRNENISLMDLKLANNQNQ